MKTYLDNIVKHKLAEIRQAKGKYPLERMIQLASKSRAREEFFYKALCLKKNHLAVIAEVKKKSPSKGILRRNFNPVQMAKDYAASGASALSVLTDNRFFGGSADILRAIRNKVRIPILRKDFILDDYQIYEARAIGADAVLLIVAILKGPQLMRLAQLSQKLKLDVLYEVHSLSDLRRVLKHRPKIIGINNRNLRTFKVDLKTTARLMKKIPKNILVISESGVKNAKDALSLRRTGVRAILIGEGLVREKNIKAGLKRLMGEIHDAR